MMTESHQMALMVVDDVTHLPAVLDAWEAAGVRGATVLESTGLARLHERLRETLPLMPTFRQLLLSSRRHNVTLFSVIDQSVDVEDLVRRTEEIVGALDGPGVGIFLLLPVSYVRGTIRPPDEDQPSE